MKTKQVLTVMITSLFILYGCSNNDAGVEGLASENSTLAKTEKGSVINQEYQDAQEEVYATFGAIATSIVLGAGNGNDGDYMDQLISFHDYGNIFTEFNYDLKGNGFLTDGAGNQEHERQFFGEDIEVWDAEVNQFAYMPGTLKIAVYYGNVANLTFISDFILTHKTLGVIPVKNLITLLFVKTNGEWKMVHEHHSPVTVGTSTGTAPANIHSTFDPSSASDAQLEVLDTFMAIGGTIMANSGDGAGSMDELISFHAYGPKFTEFNYDHDTGLGRYYNSEQNELTERLIFENNVVTQFDVKPGTLNIAVYHRNVANVTFISDFKLKMNKDNPEEITTIHNLITLLFVKTKGEWKLVHEHHSPENH